MRVILAEGVSGTHGARGQEAHVWDLGVARDIDRSA